jgi:TolB-like protein/Flp pilus assembly protein TadD
MNTTPDIFLSYNREDQAIAQRFAEGFEAAGLSVWWDVTLRSGEAYDRVTEDALRTARAVVVLWSPRSVDSRWVRAEASIADENGTLVPATIEACQLPVMFRLTQTADLSNWGGDAGDPAWQAFLGDVRRMVGQVLTEVTGPVSVAASKPANADDGIANVAVVPFTCRADDEMALFAEDLTEEVTRELARRSFYKVIAAGRMAAWRDKAVDYAVLGHELAARYIVEGKIQRVGETIRLTAQLIDAPSASMLWSQRFSHGAEGTATSLEDFQAAVGAEISEKIVQFEMDRAMTKPGPWSGWEHVLRARAYVARQGPTTTQSYLEECRQAVAAAPDMALAHAFLAGALAEQAHVNGRALSSAQIDEIQTHIKRAMQFEGDNPTVIAAVQPVYEALGEYEIGLRLARRIVELYPTATMSHFILGRAYLALGRCAEAIASFTRQDQSTSFDAIKILGLTKRGIAYFLEGRLADAETDLDRALGFDPDYYLALKWKAIVAALRGDETVAVANIQRLKKIEPTMLLDHHIWQMVNNPNLADHCADAVAILRQLWGAPEIKGEGATPLSH